MSEFFIGFAGPPQVAKLAQRVDRLVARHNEVVNRHSPLYVAVTAPRPIIRQSMISSVMAFIDRSTRTAPPVAFCRSATVLDLEDGERCIAVELEGLTIQKVVPHLLADFHETFNLPRLPLEARPPFISLLSSREVSDVAFTTACDGMMDWNQPIPDPVSFDALALFEREHVSDKPAATWSSSYEIPKQSGKAA
jgi:hypothetical protein